MTGRRSRSRCTLSAKSSRSPWTTLSCACAGSRSWRALASSPRPQPSRSGAATRRRPRRARRRRSGRSPARSRTAFYRRPGMLASASRGVGPHGCPRAREDRPVELSPTSRGATRDHGLSGIDRARSAARIERDIETLAGPDYTLSAEAIRRYAYTDVYRNTLDYFTRELEALGFEVVRRSGRQARRAQPAAGRAGLRRSARTATRTATAASTTARWASSRRSRSAGSTHELGLGLPLQLISFLEEEGSGFGQMLLGSRIIAQRVTEEEPARDVPGDRRRAQLLGARRGGRLRAGALAGVRPRPRRPRRLDRDAHRAGRVLQDTGNRHRRRPRDRRLRPRRRDGPRPRRPRGRHADGLPPGSDAPCWRSASLELERLAREAGAGTVGTVGEIEVTPGLINAIAERVRFSLDIRGVGRRRLPRRRPRHRRVRRGRPPSAAGCGPSTPSARRCPRRRWTRGVVGALEAAAAGERRAVPGMLSGAAHDTHVHRRHASRARCSSSPASDGVSHHPAEEASPGDAALAAEIMLRRDPRARARRPRLAAGRRSANVAARRDALQGQIAPVVPEQWRGRSSVRGPRRPARCAW